MMMLDSIFCTYRLHGYHVNSNIFSQVLGCRYTHAYFISYHVAVSCALRRLQATSFYRGLSQSSMDVVSDYGQMVVYLIALLAFAFATAFMETWTISSFPYYIYPDMHTMLTYGSAFYCIFLSISFHMFTQIDRENSWSMGHTLLHALATCMLVFIAYDIWRLCAPPMEIDIVEEDKIMLSM